MESPSYIIGIDEAGRGPLAGPVYVGCVLTTADFDFRQFSDLDDSKQMKEHQRVSVFKKAQKIAEKKTDFYITTSYTKAKTIDREGITEAINTAIKRCLDRFSVASESAHIYLDGGLQAPEKYKFQETITGGDSKVPIISLASVLAKVSRDQYMVKAEEHYTEFKFGQHKGYGTKAHRQAIKKHSPSDIHRRSYLSNIIK